MSKILNLEERICLVKDIKRFAVQQLGITPNPIFSKVGETDSFYIIYASRTDRIESVISYTSRNRAFRDIRSCQEYQRKLESKGYDTLRVRVEAFGDRNCFITKSLLRNSKTRIAYVVLHESFHVHCRQAKINPSRSVEEAVANCFAYQGSILYFQSNPHMPHHIRQFVKDWMRFYDFANKYLIQLEKTYKEDTPNRKKILIQAKKEAKRLSKKIQSRNVRERLILPINNAFFLRIQMYAPMARLVYETLKGLDPREYTTNTGLLYSKFRSILS